VVQQRAGVQLKGGVGATGDAYERQADAVADRVVRAQSAESLLDEAVATRRSDPDAHARPAVTDGSSFSAVQRQETPSEDTGSVAFGEGEAEQQKTTVVPDTATISEAGVKAAIQGALAKFQEKLKKDFSCTAKLTINAKGTASSVELPVHSPASPSEVAGVIEVLKGLQYPKPQPEGSTVSIKVPISIPAKKT
jgi:hypothetical protein